MCLPAAERPPGPVDTQRGEVAGAPVYIDAEQDRRWGHPALIIDVLPGAATSLSLESADDLHLVTRAPRRGDAMTRAAHHDAAKLAGLVAASSFVGDLFRPWQDGGSGWDGWGAGAGAGAGALAIAVLWQIGARVERPLAALLTAIGMLVATGLAVEDGTRWAAWAGLALAALTVAACLEAHRTAPHPPTTRAGGMVPPRAV